VLVSTVFQSVPGAQIGASFTYNKADITWNARARPRDGGMLGGASGRDAWHGLNLTTVPFRCSSPTR
jgi:hypothetical protein